MSIHNESDRNEDRRLREMAWELERQSWTDYLAAGAPFGMKRDALAVWLEHETMTTSS